jgi:Protein of unknown function (DUF4235)
MAATVERIVWRGVGLASGLVAVAATRWALTTVWERVEGREPPTNPASPGSNWTEALTWALASGAALAVSSLIARRGAAEAWKAATGSYPAGSDEALA